MNRLKYIAAIIIILASTTACVEKYWPKIDKYQGSVVVDGLLTNGDEPTIVKLSISSSINDIELIPLDGAQVYIIDNDQLEIEFTEVEAGTYQVIDSTFRGQVGNSYQLVINLDDGRHYLSDVCLLREPLLIDSLYGVIEYQNSTYYRDNLEGIQFYIDYHFDNADTNFYYWRLKQTFEYQATFDIDWIWIGYFEAFPNPDSLKTCWNTQTVNDILIFSTKHYDNNEVIGFPLNYASTQSKLLSIRYNLLVNQLSISEYAYNFLDALKQQDIDQGNLYARQPIQIKGNVKNIDDEEETVLGYFTVAGVSTKQIYLNRPTLNFYYNICTPDYDLRFIRFLPQSTWPIYFDDIMFTGWAMGTRNDCFDCRLEGGKLTPPSFWEAD